MTKQKRDNKSGIPDFELDSLARMFLPIVREFYESEEGKQEYERWKAEREAKRATKDKKAV